MSLLRNDALIKHPYLRRQPTNAREWSEFIRALNGQTVSASGLPVNTQGWTMTTAFSASDTDTVAWASGTLTLADGTDYAIAAGNTGNMTARTFIYFAPDVSETAYQTSTTATDAIGDDRILLAVAEDASANAFFQVFGGHGGIRLNDADTNVLNTTNAPEEADANSTETRYSLADWGETNTFTPTWGGFSLAPTGDWNYAVSADNRFAKIWTEREFSGTSNDSGMSISNLPEAIRPSGLLFRWVQATGLGFKTTESIDCAIAAKIWEASHASAGSIEFAAPIGAGTGNVVSFELAAWTASSSKGIRAGTEFMWPL